ncbi:MAG: nitroreductase family deazaflavin-dependent oxidoreductase [Caulobacterales bacterium]
MTLETDSKKALPGEVVKQLEAHLALYRTDPERAHLWDSSIIGLRGGIVTTLLLQTSGRKSGEPRFVTLQYFKRNDRYIIAGTKGGVAEHPAWFLNLLAEPKCFVQVASHGFQAIARMPEGEERDALWESISDEQPAYKKYQKITTRKIPVIVLEPAEQA